MSSLLVATTLLSGGLLQATTAQASSKTEVIKPTTVKMQKINSKGKATTYKYRTKKHTVKVGKKYTETPKVKGYVADSNVQVWRKANGKTGHTTLKFTDYDDKMYSHSSDKITLFKKISAKQQKKDQNSKSKSVVTFKNYFHEYGIGLPDVWFDYTGTKGTLQTVKMSARKGYTVSQKSVRIGFKNDRLDLLDHVSYVKNSKMPYKVSKLKVTKSKKTGALKVTGKITLVAGKKAKDYVKPNYIAIRDYKGQTYAKMGKKNTFNAVVKSRKAAKKVAVNAMWRFDDRKAIVLSTTKYAPHYAYSPYSVFKSVAVKNVK